jgi:dihydropteroate synthase
MRRLGCSEEGIRRIIPKGQTVVLRLENLSRIECNIIKQGILSLGGDLAVHRDVLTERVGSSAGLLIGTRLQLSRLVQHLKQQPWQLPQIGELIGSSISLYFERDFDVPYPGGRLRLGPIPQIMGVLNVTPDSFSDGGKFFDKVRAVEHGVAMHLEGARIIDVGGESTRPGAKPVPLKEELKRVIPVIEKLAGKRIFVSIDTRKAKVAKEGIQAGARMVNDITGLKGDKDMAKVIAQAKVPVIIMHIRGTPRTMQLDPSYDDLMGEIMLYMRRQIGLALSEGIQRERILVDPGIGFGKLPGHNLEILRRLDEFCTLGRPIVIGTSRKSFIGYYLDRAVDQRLFGTAATVALSILRGAQIVRVHDVAQIADVAKISGMLR